MDPESEYCLRWKKYESNFRSFFSDLFESETLVDVSLVTQEGTITHAHRIVLAACSNYFQNIFKTVSFSNQHPVIVLKDIFEQDLRAILCFMYKGFVNVSQNRVNGIIAIASSLQVKGLSAAPSQEQKQDGATGVTSSNSPAPPKAAVPVPSIQERTTSSGRGLPHLRPSPGQKRRIEESVHENDFDGDKEADFCGKPPPLLSQPTQTNKVMYASIDKTPQHNVEIKMEQVDTSFAIKDESQMSDESPFLDDSRDIDGEDDQSQGFLSSPKPIDTLNDNLGDVDFADSDYSEALEFVQQDVQFLGEPSSSAGQHFMTGANASGGEAKSVKRKVGTSESRRFKCNTCGNAYAKKSGLSRHIRTSHTGMKSFLCSLCNKNYSRSDILRKHLRRVHNVNAASESNQYNKYSHLNRHLQTHSEPRFQCDKCMKLFVRKDVLRRHLIEVHNVVVQNCKIK